MATKFARTVKDKTVIYGYTTVFRKNDTMFNPDMSSSSFGCYIIDSCLKFKDHGTFTIQPDLEMKLIFQNENDTIFYQSNVKSGKKRLCVISKTCYDKSLFIVNDDSTNPINCKYFTTIFPKDSYESLEKIFTTGTTTSVRKVTTGLTTSVKEVNPKVNHKLSEIIKTQSKLKEEKRILESKLLNIKSSLDKLDYQRKQIDVWYKIQHRYNINYSIEQINSLLKEHKFQEIGSITHRSMGYCADVTDFFTCNGRIYIIHTNSHNIKATEKTFENYMTDYYKPKIFNTTDELTAYLK